MTTATHASSSNKFSDFLRRWKEVIITVITIILLLVIWNDWVRPTFFANGNPIFGQADDGSIRPHGHHSAAEIAAAAYETLGPLPNGGQVKGHSIIAKNDKFQCPNGSDAQLVKSGKSTGYLHRRWFCPDSD